MEMAMELYSTLPYSEGGPTIRGIEHIPSYIGILIRGELMSIIPVRRAVRCIMVLVMYIL